MNGVAFWVCSFVFAVVFCAAGLFEIGKITNHKIYSKTVEFRKSAMEYLAISSIASVMSLLTCPKQVNVLPKITLGLSIIFLVSICISNYLNKPRY